MQYDFWIWIHIVRADNWRFFLNANLPNVSLSYSLFFYIHQPFGKVNLYLPQSRNQPYLTSPPAPEYFNTPRQFKGPHANVFVCECARASESACVRSVTHHGITNVDLTRTDAECCVPNCANLQSLNCITEMAKSPKISLIYQFFPRFAWTTYLIF